MQLTKGEVEKGRRNFQMSLGFNRRDFLRASVAAPALGAFYFGYARLQGPPVRAGIIGTGDEGCQAMIEQSPPDFLRYVAYHDIRPSQIKRGRNAFRKIYGNRDGERVKFYEKWEDMLVDPDIEAIVIATPLWTHAKFAIEAMEHGKHVMCEKLMARTVKDAKQMVRVADETKRLLSIGHQRHYSTLYADALTTIQSGALGEIKHIRALWHRNNTHTVPVFDKSGKQVGTEMKDSWKKAIPPDDKGLDATRYGYKSVEELIRWRLYDRTGGGLMAELGSHQLDACSIFLGKVHPLAVSGVGGKYYYDDDRECEDHVYCTFEFPEGRVVTYSSINTNAMQGYGEVVLGTRGTLMVMQERDALLFNERDPFEGQRDVKKMETLIQQAKKGESTMYSAASIGQQAEAKATTTAVSRGYTEELEHFAYCVRNPGNNVRCDGRMALGDAVMALTSIQAMRTGKRIEFKDSWFDPASDEVPETLPA